jgi:hypothetical protein
VLSRSSRHDRERQNFLPGHEMKGRPVTREEEYRIVAQERQAGIRRSASKHDFVALSSSQEFTPLFVLGMLGGIAAVLIAFFVL